MKIPFLSPRFALTTVIDCRYAGMLVLALSPLAIHAQDDTPPEPPPAPAAVIPGEGFAASKYKVLWTKSPFSVASAEAVAESADYSIVGLAKIDGVSYACLIDKSNNEHFLVTSDKPARGLTLQSVTGGKESMAILLRNGETLSLKMDATAAPQMAMPNQPPPQPGMPPNMQPGMPPPVSPYPGTRSPYPNLGRGVPGQPGQPPRIRPRHRPITVPPRPNPQGQPVPNQAPATQ